MEPATVRLRTVFEDRNMLSKSQKSSGLKRCWLLLKPQLRTISDLASYLLQAFDLEDACPNGIILSMDGYVLPPFESTCLLKDKDIISLKKKRALLSDIIQSGDGTNSLEVEVVEKQPVPMGLKLLANEEFEKETGGYEGEPEDAEENQLGDAPEVEITPAKSKASKKRKASKELRSPKSKKSKYAAVEKYPVVLEDVGNDVPAEQRRSLHATVLPEKNLVKDKSCHVQDEQDELNTSDIDERSNASGKSSPSAKRSIGLEENGKKSVDALHTPSGTTKVPSRSARRKKAKRQWLRKLVDRENKELHERQLLHQKNQQSPEKDNYTFSEKHQESDQNSDASGKVPHMSSEKHQQFDQNGVAEADFVPVVIRPGHIRFQPLGKDCDIQQNNQIQMETFQWNGITSKKKGQKWGMEKISNSRWNGYRNPSPESSEVPTIEEETSANDPVDFDKLPPYSSLPKEDDVVAYRLIELSSSWTPELSSFRVGKISRYDPQSNNILLVPVPEYPIASEKEVDEEASELQPDTSLYAEDGTLEINFSSIVDVRSVKQGNLDSTHAVTCEVNGVSVRERDAPSNHKTNANSDKSHVPTQGNGEVWEEISRALNAKKAQLSQEDDWSRQDNSGRSSWSKGLRGSALGPTMSLLRAQNKL